MDLFYSSSQYFTDEALDLLWAEGEEVKVSTDSNFTVDFCKELPSMAAD